MQTAGHLLANADNTYDIGAAAATRPRNVYVGTSIFVNSYLSNASASNPEVLDLNYAGGNTSVAFRKHVLFTSDNTHDIGASGATRPRNGYFGNNLAADGQITAGTHLFAGAAGRIAWTNRGRLNSPSDGVVTLTNAAETDFSRIQFGGTTSSSPALKRSSTGIQFVLADDSALTWAQASFLIAGTSNNASAGSIRTANNTGWFARNATNSANIEVVTVTNGDIVGVGNSVGSPATAVRIGAAGTPAELPYTKTDTGDPTGAEGRIYINTFDNVIKMYADGAWRTLVTW